MITYSFIVFHVSCIIKASGKVSLCMYSFKTSITFCLVTASLQALTTLSAIDLFRPQRFEKKLRALQTEDSRLLLSTLIKVLLLAAFFVLLSIDVPPMYVPTCCRESPWFRSSSRGVEMCVNAKRFPHFNAYFISPRVRFQEQEDDNPTRCVDVWYCTLEPNEPVKLWPHVSYQISLGLIVHRPLCH